MFLKGATIWGTNVMTFGLLYLEFGADGGGPIGRRAPDPSTRDFQSPQDAHRALAETDWHARLGRVSYANSIALSPTDMMPLTHCVKMRFHETLTSGAQLVAWPSVTQGIISSPITTMGAGQSLASSDARTWR